MQEILDKWGIKIKYDTVLSMWNESHRHYHNQSHLVDLIDQINNYYKNKSNKLSNKEYEKLLISSLFHDIIYDPLKENNEEMSSNFFLNLCEDKNHDIIEISKIILDTKNHSSINELSNLFSSFDMNIVTRDYNSLLEWESGIREEYSLYSTEEYKIGRIGFLEGLLDKYPSNSNNLIRLISFVKDN